MSLNTGRLFCRLLHTFDIATVCDVGSMDGADALRFRRALPHADILALEPNPRNFQLMATDDRLRRERIRILPLAANDRGAKAPFFVVRADYSPRGQPASRGLSSLHRRSDKSISEIVEVEAVRLDELLATETLANGPIALWIDTEGMAFEAISGAAGILTRTSMIHVEVETVPCIGANQRLYPDVDRALRDAGFVLLATDWPATVPQFNALFVRADLLTANAGEIGWHLAKARWSRDVKRALRPFVPPRLRRFLANRLVSA